MADIFLVTSAIHSKTGISGKLLPAQRIDQTIDTAKSIRVHLPSAKIFLLEGGSTPLNFTTRQRFLQEYDDIIDFSYHPFIAFAHQQIDLSKQEITVIKGPCESFMLKEACQLLDTTAVDRVYKISGRYRLNKNFNYVDHCNASGKYLMLKKKEPLPYYSDSLRECYSPWQYSTRFYSFCGSMLSTAVENYSRINSRLLELYQKNLYMDLEHTTYLCLNQTDIVETPIIGLSGCFAENPSWQIDE